MPLFTCLKSSMETLKYWVLFIKLTINKNLFNKVVLVIIIKCKQTSHVVLCFHCSLWTSKCQLRWHRPSWFTINFEHNQYINADFLFPSSTMYLVTGNAVDEDDDQKLGFWLSRVLGQLAPVVKRLTARSQSNISSSQSHCHVDLLSVNPTKWSNTPKIIRRQIATSREPGSKQIQCRAFVG